MAGIDDLGALGQRERRSQALLDQHDGLSATTRTLRTFLAKI
jgi:hypothetical protein